MVSERVKRDVVALSVSIVVNCIITIPTALASSEFGIIYAGMIVAPIFGGIFRSLIAHKKDLLFIVPGMFLLDSFIFVPLIGLISYWEFDYVSEGLRFGGGIGGIMIAASLIGLGIRYMIEHLLDKRKAKHKKEAEP